MGEVVNLAEYVRKKETESDLRFTVAVTMQGIVLKQRGGLSAVQSAEFTIREGKEIMTRFSGIHPDMIEITMNGVQSMNHHYMSDSSATADIIATITITVDKTHQL